MIDEDEVPEETLAMELVERVEEAQQAIAWAAQKYRELYDRDPDKHSYCAAMETMIMAVNGIKADLAQEAAEYFPDTVYRENDMT